jgi:hypothetical protein
MNPSVSMVQTENPACYTAAQIAAALGMSKRGMQKALCDVPPSRSLSVHGNPAQAWQFCSLPTTLQERINDAAEKHGFRNPEQLLQLPPRGWQPAQPISEIADSTIAEAHKLRAALQPSIARLNDSTFDAGERVRLGLQDYRSAFGHNVTERHWRRLIDRALRRDGGENRFDRLELYLPDHPARKTERVAKLPHEAQFHPVLDTIARFANPAAPTSGERAALWGSAFELIQSLVKSGRAEKKLRKGLLRFLWKNAAFLAKSPNALRVSFAHKYERWEKADGRVAALLDGRELKRGETRAAPIPQADIDLIAATAAFAYRGRHTPAVRALADKGAESGLSEPTLDLVNRGGSKSYINLRLANAVKHDARIVRPHILGKKAVDNATAHIERDYANLRSMMVVTADDFTLNNYFYVPDGKGWFMLTRGQCLLMIDCRSLCIIGHSLQPERNYNSLVIRTLMNRVTRNHGLPRVWYFENGIWKNSKVVKGACPTGWSDALSWPEAETEWGRLGVRFIHAKRARSKPAELVGGKLQNFLDGKPGRCGRDERHDLPDATKRAMEAVRARRVHPSESFLSFAEWDAELEGAIAEYNAEPQEGRILQGLSPDQAFEQFWPHDDPPARLDASCWHLGAHYVSERRVNAAGISFRIGKQGYRYFNARTGQDRDRTVKAWFDPEAPDLLGVTDLNGRNPYLVERAAPVDFLAQSNDPNFERELARVQAHNAYPRTRYRVLKTRFAQSFRKNLVDRSTAEVAQTFQARREEIVSANAQRCQRIQSVRSKAGRLGIAGELLRGDTSNDVRAVDLIESARREHANTIGNQDAK